MKATEFIIESAEDDINYAHISSTIYRKISNHISSNGFDLIIRDTNKNEYYAYTSKSIGLDDIIPGVVIAFGIVPGGNIKGMAGSVGTLNHSKLSGYDTIMILRVMNEFNTDNLIKRFNTTEAMILVKHESIHLLDNLRADKKQLSNQSQSNDISKYHNDPFEYNAFSHELINRYTSVLHDAKGLGGAQLENWGELYGIDRDFRTTVDNIFGGGFGKLFFDTLHSPKQKRLISRLYKLHQLYLDQLNTTK
jgi:hypothetical protein